MNLKVYLFVYGYIYIILIFSKCKTFRFYLRVNGD